MEAATVAQPTSSTFNNIDTNILLEAGTNEAEILVFRVHGNRFGVNVAKVREVLPIDDLTEIPKSPPTIDGLVRIRKEVIPLVNLECFLYGEASKEDPQSPHSLIMLEFNGFSIAFRVEKVERIYRVSWSDTLLAPQLGDEPSPVTSLLQQEQGLVPLLDFESISASIGIGHQHPPVQAVTDDILADRAKLPIVYADDSRIISEMIKDALAEGGYTNALRFGDGQEAWEHLSEIAKDSTPEAFHEAVACVITDVEMPSMDGLSLTRRIRQDPNMAGLPVILFSSIASKDNENKGEQVGATAQVSKPHYDELVAKVASLLEVTA